MGLIKTSKITDVRANVNGRYDLRNVAPGEYYLLASLDFMDPTARRRQRLAWRIPLQVGTGAVKLDLAASNSDNAAFDLRELNAKAAGGK